MEGISDKNGVDLISVGYKYNKKKVLTFVMTGGAGATRHSEPYEARFPDKFGNFCVRYVARPEIISNYFLYYIGFNLHNEGK